MTKIKSCKPKRTVSTKSREKRMHFIVVKKNALVSEKNAWYLA